MSDIVSAFQYYLGRYPESDNAHDWFAHAAGGRLEDVRNIIAESDEFQTRPCDPQGRVGTFFAPRSNARKICVLGNCQGPNIAMALSAISKEPLSICGLEIMSFQNERVQFDRMISGADHVVACKVYSDEYKDISPKNIRESFNKDVIEYSPIHFTGLHPDTLILGKYGKRLRSPMGDYNSRIVISAYLSGINIDNVYSLFNRDIYEKVGYLNEFEWSSNTMISRENNLDERGICISDWFFSELKKKPLLYTINHPNSHVFLQYARAILDSMGMEYDDVPADLICNSLSQAKHWPLDPIAAEFHGLAYRGSKSYWSNNVPMSLDEFIWRSYRIYDRVDKSFIEDVMGEMRINL